MAKIRALVPSELPMYSSIASPLTKELQGVGDVISYIALAEEDAVIDRVTAYVDVLTGAPGTCRIGIKSVVPGWTAGTTVTFTAATTSVNGTFTGGTALAVGDAVTFATNGTLPAAITAGNIYFVVSATTSVITVSSTVNGAAITFATAGTGTHTVSIYGGIPSSTWLGFVDLAGNSTNFPNFNVKQWTLTTTASLTRGQYYAVVINALSGTWNASTDRLRFRTSMGTGMGGATNAFPYTYNIIAGTSETKSVTTFTPSIGCGSSTRQYRTGYTASSVASWNSASSPNQRGIKFNLPASLCTSFKVSGVRMGVGPTNSAAQWTLTLLDSSNNVLQNRTYVNSDAYNTNNQIVHDFYFDESTLSALTPNTDYRIVVEANSASLGCMTYIEPSSSVAVSSAFIPDGTFHLTTRTGTGAWTDTTTSWFPMQLILDDLTATGGSGGGLIVHPGMSGGMRG